MDTKKLDDLALLVFNGDSAAHSELWEKIIPAVKRAVNSYARNHPWISENREDIEQGVLLAYPVWIKRYDPLKQNNGYGFSSWLYHTLARVVQDELRRQKDVLGVGIPQKAEYPEWFHLGAINDSPEIVTGGRENMQRQYLARMDSKPVCIPVGPKLKEVEHRYNYDGRGVAEHD